MTLRSQQPDQARILPRLSAPLAKLRKQWLGAVKDLESHKALAVLRRCLEAETEGATRLANIAAQSWIVRQRLFALQSAIHRVEYTVDVEDTDVMPAQDSSARRPQPAAAEAAETAPADPAAEAKSGGWVKLRVLAETEVNGMRFFEGGTIEVHEEDARKLIAAKSAEAVEPVAEAPTEGPAKPAKKARAKK
jgi:hypothetical protein